MAVGEDEWFVRAGRYRLAVADEQDVGRVGWTDEPQLAHLFRQGGITHGGIAPDGIAVGHLGITR